MTRGVWPVVVPELRHCGVAPPEVGWTHVHDLVHRADTGKFPSAERLLGPRAASLNCSCCSSSMGDRRRGSLSSPRHVILQLVSIIGSYRTNHGLQSTPLHDVYVPLIGNTIGCKASVKVSLPYTVRLDKRLVSPRHSIVNHPTSSLPEAEETPTTALSGVMRDRLGVRIASKLLRLVGRAACHIPADAPYICSRREGSV
ncbi:uncharacterized protein C8Q71DRAFT_268514 [Rhodofomes roseus]|uniref:Uncharacterized protein n=1 Tax=Rhodofomes roseus TaxID=34475 RepID=A0ABQ8K5I5_9APHY|nr:uncharacterized protein C8Q71DRAFT_268514 [Rhodofomes roseus]KAH9832253.1 hypothetical protein C8Q71DRAFT_268514 [Rhodofomes roseus]